MGLRFTPSEDGIDRCNVAVKLRFDRDELAAVREAAAKEGEPWREWLAHRAALGIEEALDP